MFIIDGMESFLGLRLKRCLIVLIETDSPREDFTDAATLSLRNIFTFNYVVLAVQQEQSVF